MNNQENNVVINLPEFPTGENIPVEIAASIINKDGMFIREAMKLGIIDIGTTFKKEGSNQYDFFISPLKFYLYTGYVYKGYDVEYQLMLERKSKKNKKLK